MRNKIILAVFVLICLTGSLSTAQAGKETKLIPDQPLVESTATYGNLITWCEKAWNVPHIYDRSTGKELSVPTDSGVSGSMQIYGNKVVWHDMDDAILIYDTSTKKIIKVATDAYSPDIYGEKVIYERTNSSQYDPHYLKSVYLYDLKTKKETQITDYVATNFNMAMYGNKIVWVRSDNPSTIYIYDIPSKKVSTTSASDVVSSLDIYGNIIVWESGSNGKSNIYMRDISTHKTTQITTSGSAIEPVIYGSRVVYENSHDIYMYDKSTSKTTRITNCGCAYAPSIYNDKIVYADSHEAGERNWELGSIYLYDLSAKDNKPTADFSANKVSGKAPLSVQFTSKTTGNPNDYYWVFEPSTSSDWNSHHAVTAAHTFKKPGTYAISLTVTNGAGSTTVTKKNYITVK